MTKKERETFSRVLRKAFSLKCGSRGCRAMTGKVNAGYCPEHRMILEAVQYIVDGGGREK